ncbi:MAG: YdcF family protein, partial [Acidobacteriota bacterium]|nr:YdcF family protein [Acidobacteriota bacterium]
PGKSLAAMGVQYFGEEHYNSEVLIHEGVPAAAIHVLDPPIINTADEIITIKAALNAAPLHTVIIVTTKPHTRRVRTLWRKLTRGDGQAIVRAASQDPFDPDHWWRNTRDALDVVREI